MRQLDPLAAAVWNDFDENERVELRLRVGARLDNTAPTELRSNNFSLIVAESGGAKRVLREEMAHVLNARNARKT